MRAAAFDHIGEILKLRATLYTAAGVSTELDEEDFMEGVSFTSGTSPMGEFTVGGAVIGTFQFTLNNYEGTFNSFDFAGSYIDPYVYTGNDSLKMGRYYIATHRTLGHVIVCTAYDALALLDKTYFTATYPLTAAQAVSTICTRHGIILGADFANQTTPIEMPATELTDRQALSHIAAITGNYAVIKADGKLYLDWYDTASALSQPTTFGHGVNISELRIDAVKAGDYITGSGDNVLDLSGNPFVTSANAAAVIQRVFNRVHGTYYRPGTVTILANPLLEAGDVISFTDDNGTTIQTIITSLIYKMGISMEATCDGVTTEECDLRRSKADAASSAVAQIAESDYRYWHTYTVSGDLWTFTAELMHAGKDITNDVPSANFKWYQKDQDGMTLLGTGTTITVDITNIDMGGAVVGIYTDEPDEEEEEEEEE